MSKKAFNLIEFISLLWKQIQELKQQTEPPTLFRIEEIKIDKKNEYKIITQVIGKAVILETTPKEVINNDAFLEGFSKQDVKVITGLLSSKKPKNRILTQEFCEKSNSIIFKIAKQGSDTYIEKTAEQISLDKDLLNDLNSIDAHKIGYVAGAKHEFKIQKQIKDRNLNKK